jgi:excisionase family DNA binding protein
MNQDMRISIIKTIMEIILNELKEIKELLKKQNIQQKEFLTIEDTSEFLGLSLSRLYKMTSNKEISHYKPGGKLIYLRRQELEQWILNSRVIPVDDFYYETEAYLGRTLKNIAS